MELKMTWFYRAQMLPTIVPMLAYAQFVRRARTISFA